ncbi:MAG: glycosyltransferase family 4 protein [Bacteroidota bacterium]
MKRQVLFCTDGIFPHAVGGMQKHSLLLIEQLAKYSNWEIIVIHPHKEKVLSSLLNIKEIAVPFDFSGFYIWKQYQYSKKISAIIKQYPEAIIYAQGFAVLHALKQFGNRVVINQHGLEPFQGLTKNDRLKTLPMRMMERFQFRHAAKVISLGGRLTNILQDEIYYSNDKIVVIPNAVYECALPTKNFDASELKLLYVGRFAHNKGIDILLESIRSLNRDGYKSKLTFYIVGKGPLYDKYTSEFAFENVIYEGFASEERLKELYESCDLFVFPTLFEGMPTVVLEAMVHGMPVIVSDTGATAELVNSNNGYLVDAGDIRAFKCAVQAYYQLSVDDKRKMSEESRSRVMNNFTWEIVGRKHIELFESMV